MSGSSLTAKLILISFINLIPIICSSIFHHCTPNKTVNLSFELSLSVAVVTKESTKLLRGLGRAGMSPDFLPRFSDCVWAQTSDLDVVNAHKLTTAGSRGRENEGILHIIVSLLQKLKLVFLSGLERSIVRLSRCRHRGGCELLIVC